MEQLEHHIVYPKPNSSKTEESLSSIIDESKPPVVILFGWVGCLDKHLEKYSEIYERRGFVTLRYTAPIKIVFWKRNELKAVGELVVQQLEEENLDDRPIFVHCMSNGGAILYVSFCSALERLCKPIKIRGVIFDSCPGGPNVLSFYRGISAVIGGNILYNWPISTLIAGVLLLFWYFDYYKEYLFPSQFEVDPFRYLRIQKNVCPQFLIYSIDDKLVFYNELEEFIVLRRTKGVDMSTLCFKSSPHVKHYASHKEEYLKGVCDFIRKCLTQ